MPETPLISIIVPVYNAEKYLRQCVESVLAQTYSNHELILVDDGSTDDSPRICDLAASESDRVKVIHLPNGGVSAARNAGLDQATGEYVAFLDADDILHPQFLNLSCEIALRNNADIVSCDIKRFTDNIPVCSTSQYENTQSIPVTLFSGHDSCARMLYQDGLEPSPCGKLFRTSLWTDERFRKGIRYEDLDLIPLIFRKAAIIAQVPYEMYFYRQHEGSYLHTFSLGRADVLKVTERLVAATADDPDLHEAALDRQLSANFNIYTLIVLEGNRLSQREKKRGKEVSEYCWEKIKELRGRSLRNPNVRLKNKIGIIASYIGGRPLINLLARL